MPKQLGSNISSKTPLWQTKKLKHVKHFLIEEKFLTPVQTCEDEDLLSCPHVG